MANRPTNATPTSGEFQIPSLPLSKKRSAVEPLELKSDRKVPKIQHGSTPGGASGQAAEMELQKETTHQKDVYLQVGRYLLEQFSVPAFRSHATIGLVDRDRIQFYHANHSVILVSSAIDFSGKGSREGLDRFIAIMIAFGRLTLPENGILGNPRNDVLFQGNERLVKSKLDRGTVQIQEGNVLAFGGNGVTEPFTITYGEVISHEPSLAGRATVVLHATSSKWEGVDLVVKISWPGSERIAENAFLDEAVKKAENTAGGKWALNHLPQVLFAQDIVFDSDSTHEKVASLFDDAEFVDKNCKYKYERRTLRIIIQERLYPLKTLKDVKDIAQVLLDVACGTCL